MSKPATPHPKVSLIGAVARNGGIGRGGGLLVHLSEDLRHFRRTTLGSPVIMGRRTWDSIGRALPGRRNIVITGRPGWRADGADAARSIDEALALASAADKAYVIGGAEIYALALPYADELVLTEIDADLEADTFFPTWDRSRFDETSRQTHVDGSGVGYSITIYSRKT